jgi:antitoxin MazE
MSVRVEEWGDSLAVRLPEALVEALGLKAGDEVELTPLPGGAIGIAKRDGGAEFLKATEQFRFPAPEGYKFDRDEANER